MTCLDKLKMRAPDAFELSIDPYTGPSPIGCPSNYGYLDDPPAFYDGSCSISCTKCWDREIPDSKVSYEQTCCIKDSGNRREFETGAVRDICEGKGRCDLMPLEIVEKLISLYSRNDKLLNEASIIHEIHIFQCSGIVDSLFLALHAFSLIDSVKTKWPDIYTMLLDVAKQFEDGAKKYGEYDWQKGIPTHCYIDSAVRHYLKFLRGDKDEPHDRAFVWNIMCCIWTCANKPELNDYPRKEENKESNDEL